VQAALNHVTLLQRSCCDTALSEGHWPWNNQTFCHARWLEKIMLRRLKAVASGFSRTTFQQIEAADKKLFILLAEMTRSYIEEDEPPTKSPN
jgi:hypothetical protein